MNFIITIVITALTFLASAFGVVNYLPLSLLAVEGNSETLGAIVEVSGGDTLSDFPAVYNANLAQLMRMSTTTLPAVTTMSGLVSIGTITTGTWNATDITVANGGTGLSTLTANAVMLGAGTSNVNFVSGLGSSGQFLTSNGAGSDPSWQSSAVALGDTYAWTGFHQWSASTTFATGSESAVSILGTLFFAGVGTTTLDFSQANTNNASSTVISTDANGKVYHVPYSRILFSGATSTSATSGTTTVIGIKIPANLLSNQAVIKGSIHMTCTACESADDEVDISLNFGGLSVAFSSWDDGTALSGGALEGNLDFYMTWDGTNQTGSFSFVGSLANSPAPTVAEMLVMTSTSLEQAIDVTIEQDFAIEVLKVGASGSVTISNVYIELIQ